MPLTPNFTIRHGPRINASSIIDKTKRQSERTLQRKAIKEAYLFFTDKMEKLKEEFENHEVTKELNAGPLSDDNPTGMLGGRSGNIWAFLGLDPKYSYTWYLWSILKEWIRMPKFPVKVIKRRDRIDYQFITTIPTLQNIYSQTLLPWTGKSWVRAIEVGMSGLSYYLFKEGLGPWSRSGKAIQAKNWATGKLQVVKAEPRDMKGRKYVSELLEKFVSYFR